MADPRQPGELAVVTRDQVGQSPPGQVRGRKSVADITAGPPNAGRRIETHRGTPVPCYTDRPAPGVRDGDILERREQLDENPVQVREDRRRPVERRPYDRAEVIRSPASTE